MEMQPKKSSLRIKVIEIKTDKSWLKSWKFKDMALLADCKEEVKGKLIEKPKVKVFGKECRQPRNVGFFSDTSIGYRYSGSIARSIPLSPNLAKLLAIINEETNSNFNGILVNQYENGNNSIGAHSDNESGLGTNGVVGISYGAERKFRIRSKTEKGIYKDIIMKNGMVIHMGGEFQTEFTHEIPVEKRINEERVSFTFRYHSE